MLSEIPSRRNISLISRCSHSSVRFFFHVFEQKFHLWLAGALRSTCKRILNTFAAKRNFHIFVSLLSWMIIIAINYIKQSGELVCLNKKCVYHVAVAAHHLQCLLSARSFHFWGNSEKNSYIFILLLLLFHSYGWLSQQFNKIICLSWYKWWCEMILLAVFLLLQNEKSVTISSFT